MRHSWLLFALILVVLACLPAYSTIPSFRGYTGLIIVPTADALGKGDWNAGVFWEDITETGAITDVVANYGLAQGLEIGINRFRRAVDDDDSDHQTLFNAKYAFMGESASRPAIAAGLIDVTDEIQTTIYVVASKTMGCSLRAWEGEMITPRITVGFGGGRLDGLFAGGSFWIGNRFQIIAEWDSLDVNVGGRWRVTPQFTIHLGGLNLTDRDSDQFLPSSGLGVGASWSMVY